MNYSRWDIGPEISCLRSLPPLTDALEAETPPAWCSTLTLLLHAPTVIASVWNMLDIAHDLKTLPDTDARAVRFLFSIASASFVRGCQEAGSD